MVEESDEQGLDFGGKGDVACERMRKDGDGCLGVARVDIFCSSCLDKNVVEEAWFVLEEGVS